MHLIFEHLQSREGAHRLDHHVARLPARTPSKSVHLDQDAGHADRGHRHAQVDLGDEAEGPGRVPEQPPAERELGWAGEAEPHSFALAQVQEGTQIQDKHGAIAFHLQPSLVACLPQGGGNIAPLGTGCQTDASALGPSARRQGCQLRLHALPLQNARRNRYVRTSPRLCRSDGAAEARTQRGELGQGRQGCGEREAAQDQFIGQGLEELRLRALTVLAGAQDSSATAPAFPNLQWRCHSRKPDPRCLRSGGAGRQPLVRRLKPRA
mmetsp:Transcript_67557/g.218344  ORF Transcript_67557/g.218344 Transcript_67557/m.218344 type:complete len:266 (-) Transcript_67557:4-801(-)